MAGRADIVAGSASIRLWVNKSPLLSGLASAGKSIAKWGAAATGVIAGFGAATGAALIKAANQFADSGDEINKMSERTGASVEALSQLRYAAGQSGASLEDLETAMRMMAKKGGSGDPVKNLEDLADKLAAIKDPGERAKAAMDAMGKSGTKLLPLMRNGAKGIRELRQEADELGLTFTQEQADNATNFGDAWDRVKAALAGAVNTIGGAVVPTLTNLLGVAKDVIVAISNWVKSQVELLTSLQAMTAALSSGDWAMAGQLAMAELKLVILDGLTLIEGIFGDAIGKIGADMVSGDFTGAWDTAVALMAATWQDFAAGVVGVFTTIGKTITDIWEGVTTSIANFIIDNQKRIKDFYSFVQTITGAALVEKALGIDSAEAVFGPDIKPGDRDAAKKVAGEQIGQTASGIKSGLDDINANAQARREAAAAALSSNVGRGGAAASAATAAKMELDRLKAEAIAAAEARKAAERKKVEEGGIEAPEAGGLASAGSFSAVAASALGGGGVQERIANISEEQKKVLEKTQELTMALLLAMNGIALGLRH